MSTGLQGQVALVTGGIRGLGHGIAGELAAAGATVYLTGRHRVDEAAAALAGTAIGVTCDHHDDAAVAAVLERIAAEQGRLDVLVNCAATGPPTSRRTWRASVPSGSPAPTCGTPGAMWACGRTTSRRSTAPGS